MAKRQKTTAWVVRQGDVLIMRVADGARRGAEVPRDAGRVVLAYGEVTGHAHAIADECVTLFERLAEDRTGDGDAIWAQAERILVATKPVQLRHEEHATIDLPPGTYLVRRQREWTGEDERVVAD